MLSYLASRGVVCFSAQYRLLDGEHAFPANVVDLKQCLVWIRANAARYGGDGAFVVASGGSAGGHLALLLALTGEASGASSSLRSLLQPGFENADTRVQVLRRCLFGE